MNDRIFYETDEGGVAVIIPTGELPLEVVARKDVPQGKAYVFGTIDDLPEDRLFRGAWEMEEFAPDGYGDPEGYWAEKAAEEAEKQANRPGPMRNAE
jgi:hypothetical protein